MNRRQFLKAVAATAGVGLLNHEWPHAGPELPMGIQAPHYAYATVWNRNLERREIEEIYSSSITNAFEWVHEDLSS